MVISDFFHIFAKNQAKAYERNTVQRIYSKGRKFNLKIKKNMKGVQIVTEEQLTKKLNQFNEIDLDDDDAVEEYLDELASYKGSVII